MDRLLFVSSFFFFFFLFKYLLINVEQHCQKVMIININACYLVFFLFHKEYFLFLFSLFSCLLLYILHSRSSSLSHWRSVNIYVAKHKDNNRSIDLLFSLFRLFAFREEECSPCGIDISLPILFALAMTRPIMSSFFLSLFAFPINKISYIQMTCLSDIWLLIPKRQLIIRNKIVSSRSF